MNDDKASQNLANTLGQLRDLRGWTQSQLAEHSGVPRPTIATLESGTSSPPGVRTRIRSMPESERRASSGRVA